MALDQQVKFEAKDITLFSPIDIPAALLTFPTVPVGYESPVPKE